MTIPSEYYCPDCGSLWDLEICSACGYIAEDVIEVPKRYLKQEYKKETRDSYKGSKVNKRKRPGKAVE